MVTMKEKVNKEDFLAAIERIKLRAESQSEETNNLENFVQLIDFAALSASNTQIIFGRNGTGKTHLLRAFYEYCESNFEKNKILPVFIDCRDLQLGPFLPNIALDDLILRFYRLFIKKIINRLEDFSEEVITVTFLEKLFGGKGKDKKDEVNQCINNLNSMINMGEIEEKLKEFVKTIELSKKGSSRIAGKLGVSGNLSPSKAEAGLEASAGFSAEEIDENKETVSLVYKGLAIINYESIRKELETLIQLCGAQSIIILVDEWPAISLSIQPLFAEMIRKTLAVSDKIYLKIVSIEYFTRTSALIDPPQRIGFQMGIDITVFANLDDLLNFANYMQEVKDFLTFVAYKHACQELPVLKQYTLKNFEDYLIGEIFAIPIDKQSTPYFEVVAASEGNPRDFLSILSSCCNTAKLLPDKRIPRKQVIGIAAKYFTQNKAPEINNNPAANKLFNKIFENVIKNHKKEFLISKNKALQSTLLQELWNFRFLHIRSSDYIIIDDNYIPHDYIIYSIDYGKLLVLTANAKGIMVFNMIAATSRAITTLLVPDIAITIVSSIVINTIFDTPKVGGELSKIVGAKLIGEEDVAQSIDITDIDTLLKDCVFDDLL